MFWGSIKEGQIIHWPKRKGQTMIYKALHRKFKIEKYMDTSSDLAHTTLDTSSDVAHVIVVTYGYII
jgi:hypothetical protein